MPNPNSTPYTPMGWKLKLKEELHCASGDVYVRRWYIETPWGSIRLHHWLHSDDDRAFHDHTWRFTTLILRGGYTDVSPNGRERMTAGKIARRQPLHKHTVVVDKGGCWSLLITGPKVRGWGFWMGQKWKKANKYFLEEGKHVCD